MKPNVIRILLLVQSIALAWAIYDYREKYYTTIIEGCGQFNNAPMHKERSWLL